MDATAGTMPQPAWPFQARKRSPRLPLAGAFLLIAGLLLLACGGGADDAPPAAPTPAATTPAPSPAAAAEEDAAAESAADAPLLSTGDAQIGPAADAPASLETEPLVWLVPAEARQGSAFLVAVDAPGAGFASVAFEGQVFTLLREGDRFFTILGIDALTPVGPLPVVIAVADAAGRPVLQQEALISVAPANWQTEVVELDESNQALLDPAVLAEDEATRHPQFRTETPERHWDGIFDPPSNGVITSSYGLLRSYNFLPPSEYHEGIDFAGANGDPPCSPPTPASSLGSGRPAAAATASSSTTAAASSAATTTSRRSSSPPARSSTPAISSAASAPPASPPAPTSIGRWWSTASPSTPSSGCAPPSSPTPWPNSSLSWRSARPNQRAG